MNDWHSSSEKIKDFHCKSCGAILAKTDGYTLFFKTGDYFVTLSQKYFELSCGRCADKTIWKRLKKT